MKVESRPIGSEFSATLSTYCAGLKKFAAICRAAVRFPMKIAGISAKLAKLTAEAAKMDIEILTTKLSRPIW